MFLLQRCHKDDFFAEPIVVNDCIVHLMMLSYVMSFSTNFLEFFLRLPCISETAIYKKFPVNYIA